MAAHREESGDVVDTLAADLERHQNDDDLISESDVSVATENFRSDNPFMIALKLMSVIQEHHQNRTALAMDHESAELIITLDANSDRERDARLLRILQALWPALSLNADQITIKFADLVDTQVLLFKNTYLDDRLYAQPTAVPVAISGENLPPAPSSPTSSSIALTPTTPASGHPFRSLPLEFTPIQVALQAQLVSACEEGDVAKVRELQTSGADLITANQEGKLPLGAAIWSCNMELVRLLEGLIDDLGPQAWQACAEFNAHVYGRSVPDVPKFSACSQSYKDLAQWYTQAHQQHIYGLTRASAWLRQTLPEVSEARQCRSGPFNDRQLKRTINLITLQQRKNSTPKRSTRNIRSVRASKASLQRSLNNSKATVEAKKPLWRCLHNQFRRCAQAMQAYVNMKITNTAVAQADNGQTAPQGRDAFYQPATPEAQTTTTTTTTTRITAVP